MVTRDRSVLVLGTSGFLGRAVVERLAAQRTSGARATFERVVAAGPRPFTPGGAVDRGVAGERADAHAASWFRAAQVDGRKPGAVAALLDAERPTAVLVVSALARGGDCERDPELAERLNAALPGEVAGWCGAAGARLVHVSTDLVFADFDGDSADFEVADRDRGRIDSRPGGRLESDPVGARDVYGRTKAAGEAAVLAACPAALVARLPLLTGDSRGRGLGASDGLLAALARGDAPTLFDDEWRTPLDVDRAAAALVALAATDAAGIVHLPGPERLSRAELGRRVAAAAGASFESVRIAPRASLGLADRPSDVSLEGGRARLLLGDGWNRPR